MSEPLLINQFHNQDHNQDHKQALLESLPTCSLCNEKVYSNANSSTSVDHRFIRPCFCKNFVHHGCAVSLIAKSKKCETCQKLYSFRSYGSCCDYFAKHKCSIITMLSIYLFSVLLCLYLLINGTKNHGYSRLLFICLSVIIFAISTTLLSYWIHRRTVKLKAFQRRFAQTTVNFHPELSLPVESQPFFSSYWFSNR